MSTTDLYILNQKSTRHVAEFRNGWGSAPRCWDYLALKYLGEKTAMFDLRGMQRVWDLAGDERLTADEKVALMFTFDRAYIPTKHLKDAGESMIAFGKACHDGVSVNHWPAIGEKLIELSAQKFHHVARGICMSPTSVSDNWCRPSECWLTEAWPILKEDEE